MNEMSDIAKSAAAKLGGGECFIWKCKGAEILVARPHEGSEITALPMQPREFFCLPSDDQQEITAWFDAFTVFSPATIGWAFAEIYTQVQFNDDGEKIEA